MRPWCNHILRGLSSVICCCTQVSQNESAQVQGKPANRLLCMVQPVPESANQCNLLLCRNQVSQTSKHKSKAQLPTDSSWCNQYLRVLTSAICCCARIRSAHVRGPMSCEPAAREAQASARGVRPSRAATHPTRATTLGLAPRASAWGESHCCRMSCRCSRDGPHEKLLTPVIVQYK